MKSALFVDFDNVHSGLRKLDPAIAERFARQPMRWVEWLLQTLELPDHAQTNARRRLLVRRVYLNPQVFQTFRASFNHAGFEIIDCPAMTHQGKTSTDIHMVLDMVDLLQHQVHYDEFIVFSADADFTPVLRKLRRWDRRTTVLAVGFPSAAYRASADLLIDPDAFVRDALGFADVEDPNAIHPAPISAPTPAMVAPSVAIGEPTEPFFTATDAAAPPPPGFDVAEITERLRNEVARSDWAVPCARLASKLMADYPGISPEWCGHHGFRRFMESLDLAPYVLDWSGSGGHLFDPDRHSLRPLVFSPVVPDSGWGLDRPTMAMIRLVHDTTGVPLLSPRDFRGLLDAVVADAAEHPFQLSETGKRVRDRCREAGLSVSREDVNWVLRGLLLCGHEFGKGEDDVPTLSYRLVGNLINLCRREQMVMDEGTPAMLQRWVSGKLGTNPSE
ncbi:hypothetical protein VITFI_CDS1504 [Vitreoscilla filiformis]|uniref:NYN domain-containing protein n=1 Tax=Vitreoscilla filiformis TaxID=63 RepID=A0A221KE28_VITFI|nr:NYN domain-containing protein [Vitreoscilla filiformis]ASM77282.1 hypothetical protein VITFI_CDS1504 [Vitreoscilla filiformis]